MIENELKAEKHNIPVQNLFINILGDFHTHTTYSHGIGDIIDSAISAQKKGLKQIAITDHGFGHLFYAINRDKIEEMQQKINIAENQTGVKIFLGVEANFVSTKGDVDVTDEDLRVLDILLVGHHRFVKSSFKDKLFFYFPNMIFKSWANKKLKKRNTEVVLAAMKKYPIDILTHLNYEMPLEIEKVAKYAAETGTYIEINENKMYFSALEIQILINAGVMFILNSDAHRPEKVGCFTNGLKVLEKYNIPIEKVANINQLPVFKKFRKDKNIYQQLSFEFKK